MRKKCIQKLSETKSSNFCLFQICEYFSQTEAAKLGSIGGDNSSYFAAFA